MNQKFIIIIILVIICGGFAETVSASNIIIIDDFSTLPSAQGWVYQAYGNNFEETDIFSVDGTKLYQNTLSVGIGDGGNVYEYWNVVDPNLCFTIDITARVIQESGPSGFAPGAFSFGAIVGTDVYGISVGTNNIEDYNNKELSSTIDNTIFHNYQIVVNQIQKTYEFYIDTIFIGSGSVRTISNPNNMIFLGDATGGSNAEAEVTYYKFEQYPCIPESSTHILCLLGFIIAVIYTKK